MERPNPMNKKRSKSPNGDFDDVQYSIDIEVYCTHLEGLVKNLTIPVVVNDVCPNCGNKVKPEGIFFCSNCEKESTM